MSKNKNEDMADAVNEMVHLLHQVADKYDVCALCLAHTFAAYVDDLEKRGIAIHANAEAVPVNKDGETIQ